MDSAHGHPDAPFPEERLPEELLRAALAAEDAAFGAALGDDPEPEDLAATVEAALQEAADTPLAGPLRARALAAPDLAEGEALLAEALEGAEEALALERGLLRVPGETSAPLSPDLRRAALAAFARADGPHLSLPGTILDLPAGDRARPTPVAGSARAPLRARRPAPLLRLRGAAVAAAAVLLLGLGLLLGGDEEAEAGLQLRALARTVTGGSVQTSRVQPRYLAAVGEVFAPAPDELLRFSLAEDAMVVVGAGDALQVARADQDADSLRRREPVLRLASGEAQLATRDHPIPLVIDGVGVLVLRTGAAHVAVDAGDGHHSPAVALHEGSEARFHRADGSGSVPLVGPTRVLLGPNGIEAYGAPAQALFHELRFFGGPLPAATRRRAVSARLFRAHAEAAGTARTRRGRQDVRLVVPVGADDPSARAVATFAWRPEPAVAAAGALEVALRAPRGTRVTLAQTDAPGLEAVLAEPGHGREPGLATVVFDLPAGWFDRLPDGRIQLRVEAPIPAPAAASGAAPEAAPARGVRAIAWFDGIVLVFGPGARSPASEGRNGGRDG